MKLSHIDENANVNMVDVSAKNIQKRTATAIGIVTLSQNTIEKFRAGNKKGDVATTAKLAGIQAAKRTWELIPLCHQIHLSKVNVQINELSDTQLEVKSTVVAVAQTGVEMEALTAVSVAMLTIYDMLKAVDKNIELGQLKVLSKLKE